MKYLMNKKYLLIVVKRMNKLVENKNLMDIYFKLKDVIRGVKIKEENIKRELFKINDIKIFIKKSVFISNNIKKYIIKNYHKYYLFSFENNTIYYFIDDNNDKINSKIYMNDVITFFKIIDSIKKLFGRVNDGNSQTIYYYPVREKKLFPMVKGSVLGPDECNSGVSFLNSLYKDDHKIEGGENGTITIFREEEHFKVLIHELIHACYMDKELILSDYSKKMSKDICINNEILLNESYTETVATILNLFFINIMKKRGVKDLDKMFEKETRYSFQVLNSILNHYKIDDLRNVINLNGTKCKIKFMQNTNVFAYYILKPLLLLYNKDFGRFIKMNTLNLKIINNEGVKNYYELVRKLLFRKKFYDFIQECWLENKGGSSLRMTLHEI